MAYVFRTFKSKTDPATGKRVPILDSKNRKVPHDQWRFQITDHTGNRRIMTGHASRSETEKLAASIQQKEDDIRRGYRPAPTSADQHTTRPITEVMGEYLQWGNSQGGLRGGPWSKGHYDHRQVQLEWWTQKLGLTLLKDLDGGLPRVEAALRDFQGQGRTGKTLSNHADSLRSFCRWCFDRGYLEDDPLKRMQGFDTAPMTQRRALTLEEAQRLLAVASPEARIVYQVALTTGLRRGELMQLKVSDFNHDTGGLNVRREISKNRLPSMQPLPQDLFEALKESAQGKDPDAPMLWVPTHTTDSLRKDLEKAGIKEWTPEGCLVFHSLRYSYITFLDQAGGTAKEQQTLARHSTPTLTMNRYAKTRQGRLSELVEQVGDSINAALGYTTTAQPKIAVMGKAMESRGLMVEDRGFEPPTYALRTHRSPN